MQLYYINTRNIVTSTCINEIEKKKSLFTSYILLWVFVSRVCYIMSNIGNSCTQYFYFSNNCVDT